MNKRLLQFTWLCTKAAELLLPVFWNLGVWLFYSLVFFLGVLFVVILL